MRILKMLLFLLVISNFILLGFLISEMKSAITGNVAQDRITANVTRVIDGDTLDITLNNITQRIRMLGINTPELKQPYHDEAMNFLKKYENKTIEIEDKGKDKYSRTLAYIYYQNNLINSEILKQGLANLYVYDKDENYEELEKAEEYARNNNIGLWKKSENHGCIDIINLKHNEGGERCTNREQLVLLNSCPAMNVLIKDDANHIEDISISPGIFTENFSCIWNDEGDSLYIRDESGLVLFYRY